MLGWRSLLVLAAWFATGGLAWSQSHGDEPEAGCTYSVMTSGPTWDGQTMSIPYDVVANAWVRDGAYGGSGRSNGLGLHSGGAAVAVASVSHWFKVTHHPVHGCDPVKFESDASLDATVSTRIHGDQEDYALAAGFQAITGVALAPTSLAVAATNAGSPVAQTTVSVAFAGVGFSLTIPGVSVTADKVDRDKKSVTTWGSKKIEEEHITIHAWARIKVVTNGPFGGTAWAVVEETSIVASTTSKCSVHSETGTCKHSAFEG